MQPRRSLDDVQIWELTDEQRAFRRDVQRFVDTEILTLDITDLEWREDPRDRVPWEVIDRGDAEYDLTSLMIPEEYGGLGGGPMELAMGTEELTYGDMGVGHLFTHTWKWSNNIVAMAEGDLLREFIDRFMGDPRHVISACLTEPAHGSDNVLGNDGYTLDTTAEPDGDEWVINGTKRFITNALDAKTFLIFAQTNPDVSAPEGTTIFMVTPEYDGLEVTDIHEKIAQRLYNNATVEFNDVRVTEDRIIGEVHRGMAVGDLLKESSLEAAATTLGTARRAFDESFAYANERVQGGTEIINHQAIAHDFSEMAIKLQAARGLIWTTARAIETGSYTDDLSSKAKVFSADVAFDVATRALEKFGGAGIMLETDPPMHRYLRDTLSYLHSDGAQTVQKEKIIRELRERWNDIE